MRWTSRGWLVVMWVACAAPGCDSNDGSGDPDAAPSSSGDGAVARPSGTDPRTLVGDFGLKIVPEMVSPVPPMTTQAAHATFVGKLFDKPKVPPIPFELEDEAGGCELLVPNIPFCDPRCTGSVCTEDGCMPDAVAQSAAGSVRVLGLGETRTISPIGSSPTYQIASLPYPPCAEGDAVRVQAEAFSIETSCVAALEVAGDPVRVRSGEPTALAWTPPDDTGLSRIEVELDISHHGGQKGQIDCDVPDTGSFEIPESLVTRLVALGVAGYPTITLTRVARGVADAAPDVTLTASSHALRPVDLGISSCSRDEDCPDAMTCDLVRLICQ
jgi:hypothetical protein